MDCGSPYVLLVCAGAISDPRLVGFQRDESVASLVSVQDCRAWKVEGAASDMRCQRRRASRESMFGLLLIASVAALLGGSLVPASSSNVGETPTDAPLVMAAVRNPGWTQEASATSPPSFNGCGGSAYDSVRGRVVLASDFVGSSALTRPLWEYDGATWQNRTPGNSPLVMDCPEFAFDADARQTLLLSEPTTPVVAGESETWGWNGRSWTLLTSGAQPRARTGGVMGYDPLRHQTILFGGQDDDGFFIGDTWLFAGNHWTALNPTSSPGLVSGASMTYDAALGGLVLYGGGGPGPDYPALHRLWLWDGTTWRDRGTGPADISTISYDAGAHRLLALGRSGSGGIVWSYDGSRWSLIPLTPAPQIVGSPSFVYDAAARKTLLFGGSKQVGAVSTPASETWALRTTAASSVVGFVRTRATVRLGGELVSAARVSSHDVRLFSVQIRRHGTSRWTTQSRGRSTASGALTARFQPPRAGTWDYRIQVDPEVLYAGAVSGVRTVSASGRVVGTSLTGASTKGVRIILTQQVAQALTVRPGGRRTVELQVRAPGKATYSVAKQWTTSVAGKLVMHFSPATTGTWYCRLFVRPSATAAGRMSGARKVVVLPIPVKITTPNPSLMVQVMTSSPRWLRAAGGTGPYSWSVVSGHLPPGMTLSSVGLLAGDASAVGSFAATVQVKDRAGWPARTTVRVVVITGTPLDFGAVANRISGPVGLHTHVTGITCPVSSPGTFMYLWFGGPGVTTPAESGFKMGGFTGVQQSDMYVMEGTAPGVYPTDIWCIESNSPDVPMLGNVVRTIPVTLHVTAQEPIPTTTATSIRGGQKVVIGDGGGCGAYAYPDHATVTLSGDAPTPAAVTVTKDVPLGTDGHFADATLTAPTPAADNPVTTWSVRYTCFDSDGSAVYSGALSVPAA